MISVRPRSPRPPRRRAVAVSGLLLTVGLGSCDTTPLGPLFSEVSLAVEPNPAVATASTMAEFSWQTTFTVTATEMVGISATIDGIVVDVFEASGGVATSEDPADSTFFATQSTYALPGSGQVAMPLVVDYILPGGGREAVIEVAVRLLDTGNVRQTETIELLVR